MKRFVVPLLLLAVPWLAGWLRAEPPPVPDGLFVDEADHPSAGDPASEGERIFRRIWIASQLRPLPGAGLGPLYNATSCSFCHLPEGLADHPPEPGHGDVPLLVRLSVPGEGDVAEPEPRYGWQLQDHGAGGARAEGQAVVSWHELPGRYPDGTPYRLRQPEVRFADLSAGPLDPRVQTSLRFPPALAGLGRLEAVPEAEIVQWADPDDANRDGVSGRPNRVTDLRTGIPALGRFGWKASQPTLEQQHATALQEDMGITSNLLPLHPCMPGQPLCRAADAGAPEITSRELDRVTGYVRGLPPPQRPDGGDPAIQRGESLFQRAGCASCHRQHLDTAAGAIQPYTDLLLHDLGPGLADGRPDVLATGREWRTAPLWGLGRQPPGGRQLLHDGRARSLEEAVLWHGGEAAAARDRFKSWPRADRAALLQFLDAL
jgi:CxxC motif-containing protein (DUF1111 family)